MTNIFKLVALALLFPISVLAEPWQMQSLRGMPKINGVTYITSGKYSAHYWAKTIKAIGKDGKTLYDLSLPYDGCESIVVSDPLLPAFVCHKDISEGAIAQSLLYFYTYNAKTKATNEVELDGALTARYEKSLNETTGLLVISDLLSEYIDSQDPRLKKNYVYLLSAADGSLLVKKEIPLAYVVRFTEEFLIGHFNTALNSEFDPDEGKGTHQNISRWSEKDLSVIWSNDSINLMSFLRKDSAVESLINFSYLDVKLGQAPTQYFGFGKINLENGQVSTGSKNLMVYEHSGSEISGLPGPRTTFEVGGSTYAVFGNFKYNITRPGFNGGSLSFYRVNPSTWEPLWPAGIKLADVHFTYGMDHRTFTEVISIHKLTNNSAIFKVTANGPCTVLIIDFDNETGETRDSKKYGCD